MAIEKINPAIQKSYRQGMGTSATPTDIDSASPIIPVVNVDPLGTIVLKSGSANIASGNNVSIYVCPQGKRARITQVFRTICVGISGSIVLFQYDSASATPFGYLTAQGAPTQIVFPNVTIQSGMAIWLTGTGNAADTAIVWSIVVEESDVF